MSVIAELKSRVRELDAELKAEKLSKSANAALVHEKNLELTQLRARHAALVEKVQDVINRGEVFDAKGSHSKWVCDKLKAALAEVKR